MKVSVSWNMSQAGGKRDSIAIKNSNAELCPKNEDSDAEKHVRAGRHEQARVVSRLNHDGGNSARDCRLGSLLL
jgi:hypothetical protein